MGCDAAAKVLPTRIGVNQGQSMQVTRIRALMLEPIPTLRSYLGKDFMQRIQKGLYSEAHNNYNEHKDKSVCARPSSNTALLSVT